MNTQQKDMPIIPRIKAGDIIATRASTLSSWLIQFATWSTWSHVGIAISEDSILEAAKVKKKNLATPEVREVSLADFLNGSSQALHLECPHSLTNEKMLKLKDFVLAISDKNYTIINAAATCCIPFLRCIYFIFGFSLITFAIQVQGLSIKALTEISLITIILFAMYRLQLWLFRCKWGVKPIERMLLKWEFGTWLVNEKYNMFCSKLVLLVNNEVGGQLQRHTPDVDEVQPCHVVKACKKLGWHIRKTIK